tara:strand:- start:861 stop:1364 length:504 start_codon:yes stop_codon:yes gene_type:complete
MDNSIMGKDNPKLRKNGGNGTAAGNLLRGLLKVGKKISPQLGAVIDAFTGEESYTSIESQLAEEGFDHNELQFLLGELNKDKQEFIEITKRWESDNKSDSWLPKNIRPLTLALYNLATIAFIYMDSKYPGFIVKEMWITLLITNTGMINTAYFGSKYLEKRDNKKYR